MFSSFVEPDVPERACMFFMVGRCRCGIHCNPFMARFSLSTVQRYDNAAAQSCTFLTSCSTLFAILSSPLYIVRFIYRGMILFFVTPLDRIPSKKQKSIISGKHECFHPRQPCPLSPCTVPTVLHGGVCVAGCAGCQGLEVKKGILSAVPSARFRALDAVPGKTDGTVEGMGAEILHTALFRKSKCSGNVRLKTPKTFKNSDSVRHRFQRRKNGEFCRFAMSVCQSFRFWK